MLITKMVADEILKEWSLCMLLNWYKFKSQYYNFRMLPVIIKITKNKIAIEYTQKEMRK